MNNYARLKPDSVFNPVFKNGWVPVKNVIAPTQAECIGDGVQDVYMVDLDKLTTEEFDLLAKLVVSQCDPGFPLEKAKEEMRERGLPLRAKHVVALSSNSLHFL